MCYNHNAYLRGGQQDQVRQVAEALENKGHVITKKWWEIEQANAADRSPMESRKVGLEELEGSATCDVMVVFFTDPCYPYKGTLCELGIALGSRYYNPGHKIIIVTPEGANNKDYIALRVPHVYAADHWLTMRHDEPWVTVVPEIDKFIKCVEEE